ncbi:probable WRKY transcription factor 70 isoform X1 [Alnus glutinosa]|uniref:probable WRKY transcription factor 70 isoform X1 n=1 Tax=Alnus glutinosa TaxID=3517 RepID=UPI002D766FE3|nr:probable WRKY transcription factor 70 isoform X1 [Alnus glutinosa]
MGTPWPEKLSNTRQKVIKELVQGQECATQLKTLLHKTLEDQLVSKILRSFTESISVLTSFESGEVCQNLQAVSHADSHCDDRRSEDSGESSRKRPASKDRRGCYRRRKTAHTWTTVSPTVENDGHAWRKYGQKEILNAKHPRSYFRCTRKFDQGCRATKQVQRKEDDPQMFQTTYIGHHTCRDILKTPQIITECHGWESFLGNSESAIPSKEDGAVTTVSSSTPTIKEESKEEALSDLTDNLPSLGDHLWPDLKDFELSGPMGSDNGDVVSTMYSCRDTDSLSLNIDFDGDFSQFL